jgi:hypothetical protein
VVSCLINVIDSETVPVFIENTLVPWIASNLVCECFARRAKIFNKF